MNPFASHTRICLLTAAWLLTIFSVAAAESPFTNSIEIVSPRNYQVSQRLDRWTGRVHVSGALTLPVPGRTTIESRFLGTGLDDIWRPLAEIAPGHTAFEATVNLRAGGWYRLEVRAVRLNTILSETAIEHVGIGEIFVIAGQSNSANHGEERLASSTGMVSTWSGKDWTVSKDPQPGASGGGGSFIPPFGDAMVEKLGVPIGIVSTGVGATSVREWLPRGTRFSNPPTLTGNVTQLSSGGWESKGDLFQSFVNRIRQLGPEGFRAVLWHQGESDANQKDPSRTLSGADYERFMEKLIRDSQREIGWRAPWFVAQVSYHTPDDPGSADIRSAQASLWKTGVALEGPDTDALTGNLRDGGGKGVHFSGAGLREHGRRWAEKVSPWIESRLTTVPGPKPSTTSRRGAPPRLDLHSDRFPINGRPAFIFMPEKVVPGQKIPWIFYAPTLPAYPDEAERWMHEQFLSAGIAVAGIDVGEAYGSPDSHSFFNALYDELTERRGFAARPCLFGRSRGGLWVSSWAISNPNRISGIIGIYPVYDFRTYPGLKAAAPAYGVNPQELSRRAEELNPISQAGVLARAGIPVTLIHGDMDSVVPLKENSAELARIYHQNQAEALLKLIILKGQGHNFYEGFFHSQELVDFAIARARAGARP